MKYNTVIFDLDGTLTDTLDDLKDSVNYALRQYGFPERTREEIRSFVGNGVKKLVGRSVPAGTDEKITADVLKTYVGYYAHHSTDKTGPYEGIPELLSSLKAGGFRLGVVSNKQESAVISIVKYYFGDTFDTVSGQVEGMPQKPAPDGVLKAMENLHSGRSETVYVGDSDVDCITAHNAGLPVIGVSWGFRGREVLEANGAEYIAETPSDIEAIVSGKASAD